MGGAPVHQSGCMGMESPKGAHASAGHHQACMGQNSVTQAAHPAQTVLLLAVIWTHTCSPLTQIQNKQNKENKNNKDVACRMQAKEEAVWCIYWQLYSPGAGERAELPLHTQGTRWRRTFPVVTHDAPLTAKSHQCFTLPLSGAWHYLYTVESPSRVDSSQKAVYVSAASSSSVTSTWLYCLQAFRLHFRRTAPSCFPGPTS